MWRRVLLSLFALALLGASPREEQVAQMLRDPLLVGRDFPTVIASLPAFDAGGEKTITVLSRRVAGETRFRDEERATRAAAAARAVDSPLRIAVIVFPDDRSI